MTREEAEKEFPCEGHLCLGDFMYAGQRIRLHCKDNETEYYVIRGMGKNIETYTFYQLTDARAEFSRGVENIITMNTNSDTSIYMQQGARYAKGSKRKFAKKKAT